VTVPDRITFGSRLRAAEQNEASDLCPLAPVHRPTTTILESA
jgi:hypothetical protein